MTILEKHKEPSRQFQFASITFRPREPNSRIVRMAQVIFNSYFNKMFNFADSFMAQNNIQSPRLKYNSRVQYSNLVNIEPHVVKAGPTSTNTVNFVNHAMSSNTMDRALGQVGAIEHWANDMPKVTIIHLGAVDIANYPLGKSENIRQDMRDKVLAFIDNLKREGRERARDVNRFDHNMDHSHIFLFVLIPDWGNYGEGKYENSLNSNDFARARKRANQALQNMRAVLWSRRVVLFAPRLENPVTRRGPRDIHLSGDSNIRYCTEILTVAARLCCSECSLSTPFKKQEHTHEALLAPSCAGRQA